MSNLIDFTITNKFDFGQGFGQGDYNEIFAKIFPFLFKEI